MALTFFHNASKANAELNRVTGELEATKAQVKDLLENESEAIKAADALQEKLATSQKAATDAQAALAASASEIETLKTQLAKANADLKAAQDEVAALPAKVEAQAAKVAVDVVASAGQPALPAAPAAAANPDKKLFGLAKVRAAIKEQLNKK